MEIYFDNAATTEAIGNPSSPHKIGLSAERALAIAREEMACLLKCKPSEVIFTSGGTEANNLAILGFAKANRHKPVSYLTQEWEHPSIVEPLKHIKEEKSGTVIFTPHEKWISNENEVIFAAISHVNNETGDIHNVAEIAKQLKDKNPNTTVLVDGVQGFGKEPLDLTHIDMYSFSAHKFGGPSGVGGLLIKRGIKVKPLMYGGGQECALRPGTENLTGILHMVEVAKQIPPINPQIKLTLLQLSTELADVCINQTTNKVSDHILNMSFLGVRGEPLVHMLSERGVHVSMGAACRSKKNSKTVLEVMGFAPERSSSAVRFSFSPHNTVDDAVKAKEIIIESVTSLRKMLGGRQWK